jgi:hypothetical protein
MLIYFFIIALVTHGVNELQKQRIFSQKGEEFDLDDHPDSILPSRTKPDLVTITGTSLYFNNKYIPGSIVLFRKED